MVENGAVNHEWAHYREDMTTQFPQNIYRAVFGKPSDPETLAEIGALLGDRGALEIAMILANLSDREAEILRWRYAKNKTLEETGEQFGISSERTRSIEAKALRKLRRENSQKLLRMGAAKWLNDLVQTEAKRLLDEKVPREVNQILSERIDEARRFMDKEAERLYLIARDGTPQETVPVPVADSMEIEKLDLSVRAYNCLKRGGMNTVGDIVKRTRQEIMDIRNMGKKSYDEIVDKVVALGYELKEG